MYSKSTQTANNYNHDDVTVGGLHDVRLNGGFEQVDKHRVVVELCWLETLVVQVRQQRHTLQGEGLQNYTQIH